MDLGTLKFEVQKVSVALQRRVGELQLLYNQAVALKKEIADFESKVVTLENVVSLFNSFGETEQADLKTKIETLVSYGLQSVFQERIEFKIVSEVKGRQVTMKFTVKSGEVETDILDARGGGIAVVAGFILQVVVIVLMRTRVAKILVLDEGLAQLSEGYRARMADFIRELVEKTDIQIIFVTHQKEYVEAADIAYQFEKNKNGNTVALRITDGRT